MFGTLFMAAKEEKFVVQLTDDEVAVKYLVKYISLKNVKATNQLPLAKIGKRLDMIRLARLLRKNGFKAWAKPIPSP